MHKPSSVTLRMWATAIILWLALAFSLGWYHHATPPGGKGYPTPTPESAAAVVAYLFVGRSFERTMAHLAWMAAVPIAGLLWLAVQYLTAGYFGATWDKFREALVRYAWASLPLIVPGPVLTFMAWKHRIGYWWWEAPSWKSATATPWPSWLGWTYLGLGALVLTIQYLVHRKTFRLAGKKAMAHFLVSLALLIVIAAGAGGLLNLLLRALP